MIRRSPAAFKGTATLTLIRDLFQADALRPAKLLGLRAFAERRAQRWRWVSAFGINDSIYSQVCRLCGHPACANKSSGRDTARDRRHPTQPAGFSAVRGGWIAPLRRSPIRAARQGGLNKGTGEAPPAFADAERSEALAAVATRRAALPRSADSVALSRAGKQTAGATFADAERSDALRSLGRRLFAHFFAWTQARDFLCSCGQRPVLMPAKTGTRCASLSETHAGTCAVRSYFFRGVCVQAYQNDNLLIDKFWTSSRSSKTAAPLPLASASATRSLNLPRQKAKKVSAALVPLRSRLRSRDALRAQGSSVGHYDCSFLRASQQAHTAPPRTGRAGRPAAALRSNLQEQVAEMGEKMHHQVAVFSTSRSHSTRRAARSAPGRSLSLELLCFRSGFRVDIPPLSLRIFRQQSYRNQLTGLRYAPLDASLFYNFTLSKAWGFPAPLPAGFAAACMSRQHGHPRKAASSRTCAGCVRRRQPGAPLSKIYEVKI